MVIDLGHRFIFLIVLSLYFVSLLYCSNCFIKDIFLVLQIIFSALVNITWCTYFFDTKIKCVHVADPTYNRSKENELKKLHESNILKIKSLFQKLIKELYSCWDIDFTLWESNYLKPIFLGATR